MGSNYFVEKFSAFISILCLQFSRLFHPRSFSKMGHWLYSSMTTLLLLLSSLNLDNQFDLRHVNSNISHSQTLFIPNFKIVLQSFQFTDNNKAKRYHEINSLPLVFNKVLEPLHFKPYNLKSMMVFTPSYSFIQQHNRVINDYSQQNTWNFFAKMVFPILRFKEFGPILTKKDFSNLYHVKGPPSMTYQKKKDLHQWNIMKI